MHAEMGSNNPLLTDVLRQIIISIRLIKFNLLQSTIHHMCFPKGRKSIENLMIFTNNQINIPIIFILFFVFLV